MSKRVGFSRNSLIRQQEMIESIERVTSSAYDEVKGKIKDGDLYGARQTLIALNYGEDKLVARVAIGRILCELYSRDRAGSKSREDDFYLSRYIKDPERGEFLREMGRVLEQVINHKRSEIPTLGNRARVILDGLEDVDPTHKIETGLNAWNKRQKRISEEPGKDKIRIRVSDDRIEIETNE